MSYIVMVVVGLAAGILGAVLGIGGGIIMLPATQFLLNFDPVSAVGTTLFAVVFTSMSGAYGHYKRGNVIVKNAVYIGSGGLIGVLLGSYVFKQYLSTNVFVLQFLLGIIFLFMAFKMFKESYDEWRVPLAGSGNTDEVKNSSCVVLVLVGVFTGSLTGMMGLGGGFIMVPAMIWLFRAAPYEAVGTTLLAMLPIALTGGVIKLYQGFVDIGAGTILGMGTVVGAQAGVYLSRFIKPLVFKLLFTLIFAYLAFNYLGSSLYGVL